MKSSNSAGDQTLTSQDNEVEIPVVAVVAGTSKSGEQSPNQTPGPLVEVFTTTVSNLLEWSVTETPTEAGTLSYWWNRCVNHII